MDLIIGFGVFLAAMVFALLYGYTLILPMSFGLAVFFGLAISRGNSPKALTRMIIDGINRSLTVVITMLLIGALTSLWRQCGTIAYFTYYGILFIPGKVFILCAFVLSGLMSYALGTSFGTCSAVGIILMTIARANGISPVITGGAIMSGIYIGDRGSPASSSAALVANETGTDLSVNFRKMLKESTVPMVFSAILYLLLSLFRPSTGIDTSILELFPREYNFSLWCLLPTFVLLVPIFCGMKIRTAMLIDIAATFITTILLQGTSFTDTFLRTFTGAVPVHPDLVPILSGGGVFSMLQISVLLLISNGCAGIFRGTGMLSSVELAFRKLTRKIGRFPAMVISSIVTCAVFCNQTIGIVMCRQCMESNYSESNAEKTAMMLDLEDSVITIAGLVPWCIACSVPIGMLGCGFSALPFAFYLYMIPVWHLILGVVHSQHPKDIRR